MKILFGIIVLIAALLILPKAWGVPAYEDYTFFGYDVGTSYGTSDTVTFAHTISSGTDRLLVVAVGVAYNETVTNVLWGEGGSAQSLTLGVSRAHTAGWKTELWYLIAPTEGSDSIFIDMTGGHAGGGHGAFNFTNVLQTNPIGASAGDSDGRNTVEPVIWLTTQHDGSIVLTACTQHGYDAGPYAPSVGQVEVYDQTPGSSTSDPYCWAGYIERENLGVQACSLDASNDDYWAIVSIEIRQTPPTDTCCTIYTSPLAFGDVYVDSTEVDSFYIKNCGDSAFADSIHPGDLDAIYVVTEADSAYDLDAGDSIWFHIEFTPVAEVAYPDTMDLGNEECTDLILSGTGIPLPPDTCCSTSEPDTIAFGFIDTLSTSDQAWIITNCGLTTLTESAEISGHPYFTFVGDSAWSVAEGESDTLTFRFTPTTSGEVFSDVISGSDSCGGVVLKGTGVPWDPVPTGDNIHYMDNYGDDGNTGVDPDNAWATLDYAESQMEAGDTLFIMGGAYDGTRPGQTMTLSFATPGTAISPIVFKAYGDSIAVFSNTGEATRSAKVYIAKSSSNNANHTVIDGCSYLTGDSLYLHFIADTLQGTGTDKGHRYMMSFSGTESAIDTGIVLRGIEVDGHTFNYILSNDPTPNQFNSMVYFNCMTDILIEKCYMHEANRPTGCWHDGMGEVGVWGDSTDRAQGSGEIIHMLGVNRAIIQSNVFERANHGVIGVGYVDSGDTAFSHYIQFRDNKVDQRRGGFFYLYLGTHHCLVENNLFMNGGQSTSFPNNPTIGDCRGKAKGLQISGDQIVVRKNVFHSPQNASFGTSAHYYSNETFSYTTRNNLYYNNTMYGGYTGYSFKVNQVSPSGRLAYSRNNRIFNNIMYAPDSVAFDQGAREIACLIYIYDAEQADTSIDWVYNVAAGSPWDTDFASHYFHNNLMAHDTTTGHRSNSADYDSMVFYSGPSDEGIPNVSRVYLSINEAEGIDAMVFDNNVAGKPLLTSLAPEDYGLYDGWWHLQSGSPAIDAGRRLTGDFEDTIGAYVESVAQAPPSYFSEYGITTYGWVDTLAWYGSAPDIGAYESDEIPDTFQSDIAPPAGVTIYPRMTVLDWSSDYSTWDEDLISEASNADLFSGMLERMWKTTEKHIIDSLRSYNPDIKITGYTCSWEWLQLVEFGEPGYWDTTGICTSWAFYSRFDSICHEYRVYTNADELFYTWEGKGFLNFIDTISGEINRDLIEGMVGILSDFYNDAAYGEIDGIMHDYFTRSIYVSPSFTGMLDFDRDGHSWADEWANRGDQVTYPWADEPDSFYQYQIEYIEALRAEFGNDFLITGNGRMPIDVMECRGLLNGVMYENWPGSVWGWNEKRGFDTLMAIETGDSLKEVDGEAWSFIESSETDNELSLYMSMLAGCTNADSGPNPMDWDGWTCWLGQTSLIGELLFSEDADSTYYSKQFGKTERGIAFSKVSGAGVIFNNLTPVEFDTTYIGLADTIVVFYKNNGSVSCVINIEGLEEPFSTDSLVVHIPAGDTSFVNIVFSPPNSSAYSDTIMIAGEDDFIFFGVGDIVIIPSVLLEPNIGYRRRRH